MYYDHFSNVLPLVESLCDASLSAAKLAMQFLVNVSDCHSEARESYFDNPVRARLENIVNTGGAVSKLRVFEVAVDIAKKSRQHLQWSQCSNVSFL